MKRPRNPRLQRCRPLFSEPLERRRLLASASQLLAYDFTTTAWQQSPGAQSSGVSATLVQGGFGTIDVEGGTTPSGGLRLTVDAAPASAWSSDLTSGPLAVANTTITNLGLLTLSFSLSASQARPVKVFVTSYDANNNRTGGLTTTVVPATAYTYQRYALDLSTMKPSGSGTFNPTAPKVSFDYEMSAANGWSTATAAQLRLDNVAYSKPAYYVKAVGGSNSFDGRTEATAFATPQKALDVAQPGDVIDVMNGTYSVLGGAAKISFVTGGTPAAWVSLKNYPGQSPTIYNEWWNAILIGRGTTAAPSTAAALAYIEVRGLHIVGDNAKVGGRSAPDGPYDSSQPAGTYGVYGQYINQSDGRTNGNGISVDGRSETHKPHDIRIADNLVENGSGAGIGAGDADRIQIEGNVVRDNCYWDIYATSGISVLSTYNFEGTTGSYTRLVRDNVVSGNIHKEMWAAVGKYSDGNGIIIDINFTPASDVAAGKPYLEFRGRTLVTNNVCFDNGGSGIHAFNAKHVDIVNNVAYLNSASDKLQYGQIFAGYSDDVRIYNNILVAPVAAVGKPAEPVNGNNYSTNVVFNGNVYFGGNTAPVMGTNDVKADPKFVLASVDASLADFRLQSSSPAINRGTTALAPYLDADGSLHFAAPDSGAYEFVPAAPTAVTLAAASDTGTPGDGKTNLNNAATAKRLSFLVAGTLAGATVTVYADGVAVGSATATGATTTVVTDGATTLADGTRAVTAGQTFASSPSAASPALAVVVDTSRPALAGVPVVNLGTPQAASRSQVRTLTFTFGEPVAATTSSFALADRDSGAVIDLSSRSVAVAGNVVTLTLDAPGVDAGPQLFLPDGNYALTLLNAADAAGNGLDPAAGTPTFGFFKLLGDFNGGRSVTATDYSIWRAAFGQPVGGADGVDVAFDLNASASVTATDYSIWRAHFGDALAPRDDDGLAYAPPAMTLAASLTAAAPTARVTLAKITTPKTTTTTKTTTTRSSR